MKKIFFLMPLVLILISFGVTAVATCTIEEDSSGAIHKGTRDDGTYGYTWFGEANVIVNVSANTGLNNVTNCTLSVATRSEYELTANTSESIDASRKGYWNLTANMDAYKYINETVNTACGVSTGGIVKCLEDGFYTLTLTCYNQTSGSKGTCTDTANVMVDNTATTAPTSLSPEADTSDGDGNVDFTASTTETNITSCELVFSGAKPYLTSYDMEHSGDTCTLNGVKLPASGSGYSWAIEVSDGLNTSTSEYNLLKITSAGNAPATYVGSQIAAQQAQQPISGNTVKIILIVIGILWLLNRKKRR